jgi:hypothetical protein
LVAGSDDYYDVTVTKLGELNYKVNSTAYKEKDGEQVGRSSLTAELRLDPAIAYWCGGVTTISDQMVINGDMYCGGNISGAGPIYGDAYAWDVVTATNVQGKKYESVATPTVPEPGLIIRDYKTSYRIGSQVYSVDTLASNSTYSDVNLAPTANNPAGVYYCKGHITFAGNVNITGMLVVTKSIFIESGSDITITAVKNFPALLTDTGLWFVPLGPGPTRLRIIGLAQVQVVDLSNIADTHVEIVGAMVSQSGGILNTAGCTVNITAAPDKAAIEKWPTPGTPIRWSPAAGAFFRSIEKR